MSNIFFLLFIFSIFATIVFLIKPSLTAFNSKPAFSRIKILLTGLVASLVSLALLGIFIPKINPEKPNTVIENTEKSSDKTNKESENYKQKVLDQQQALAEEDKPHFEWPRVDYRKSVAKVDLNDDKAILKAVGKPVQDTESGADSNGEPMKSYWFSKQIAYGLQIDLSREQISVMWQFNDKDLGKATAAFEQGQQITRALLGGKAGSELYENIAKGLKYDQIITDDGTVIKNARCGAIICRYEIVR